MSEVKKALIDLMVKRGAGITEFKDMSDNDLIMYALIYIIDESV
jgi:hypothetical protein